MGVTGLWTVVAPTARPTQLATLNRKRLAVDASIWIYQFLKAVRDKEGNALRNSHVVGFFRRICKLLYFGIKPVFVFDGGAPILKRETVRGRARRREGRREDAARTAGKLLALQVARAAEEEDKKRKAERSRHDDEEEEIGEGEELVYVDEIGMTQKERQLNRGFKRRDQYHLPDLDVSIESMGAPNDPRIMSQAELEEYARQFHTGEEINLYDFSKIDFESPFFLSLPPGDRYNILNAARLRSRLRMGYSKQQLDGMFPDRMAFSRFQIERVKERNELTQRLMHINGMAEDYLHQGGRIAGEKGKEYVLVKNEGVEGGWALGVVSNKGRARENAIDLDEDIKADSEEPEDDDEDFEDVAIEGLNRLPKTWPRKKQEVDFNTDYQDAAETIARRRKAVYEARQQAALNRAPRPVVEPASADADTLFMSQPANGDTADDEEIEELFEDVDIDQNGEEDDLRKAIAMSLEQLDGESGSDAGGFIASESDRTAHQTMRKMNSAVNDPGHPVSDDEEGFDLQAALAESRKSKYLPKTTIKSGMPNVPTTLNAIQPLQQKFSGPLPFESLNLGQSLLGKKKSEMVEEDMSGGFERDLERERQKTSVLPLPSWFNAAPITSDLRNEDADVVEEDHYNDHITYGREEVTRQERILRRIETEEVIDVDAPSPQKAKEDIILVESSDDEMSKAEKFSETQVEAADEDVKASSGRMPDAAKGSKQALEVQDKAKPLVRSAEIPGDGVDVRMDDITDLTQAEPPPSDEPNVVTGPKEALPATDEGLEDEELVEWSESDIEDGEEQKAEAEMPTGSIPASDIFRIEPTLSQSPDSERLGHGSEAAEGENDFEDVAASHNIPPPLLHHEPSSLNAEDVAFTSQYLMADEADTGKATEDSPDGEEADAHDGEYISDSDEELFRQLAIEAEEHARFASSLNNKTPAQAARDYEDELKRLRNQQKKDRRDADEVTQTMVQECQALLRLFGLPYITAPMEAEAQCAELVHLGLVDGIVTDDSDIFLFGGTRIYKNMFNAAKFVECYLLADLEKEYALDRRKLIRFAHLLGSDYTEGIPGIGPVSALEILTDFDTLEEFKEWCSKVQLGRPQDLEHQLSTPFRRKFRNTVQKRLFLPPSFPDIRVDQAYLQPEVDSDPEPFQWGVPDLDKLRSFLMATIGWSQERTDEILVPVIRTLNQQEKEGTQANITHFFSGGVGVGASREGNAPRNRTGKESRRLKNAYTTLKGKAQRVRREAGSDGDGDNDLHATSKGNVEDGSVETGSNGANDAEVVGEAIAKQTSGHKKRAAKAKAPTSNDSSDDETEDGDFAPKKGRKKRRRRVADG